jgi:hypothetical protein
VKSIGGLLLIVAALATGSSCVTPPDWIERTLVTVDVTGVWYGTISNSLAPIHFSIDLKQEGPKVEGSLKAGLVHSMLKDISGPVEGTVSGDRFEFRRTNGSLHSDVTVSGDEMIGLAHGTFGPGQTFLRRVKPSPPLLSP